MDSDSDQQPRQILKPRNPGEGLKVAETVLRKRNRDLRTQAERAQKRIDLKKDAKRQRIDVGVVTPEKLVKDGMIRQIDAKRVARLRNLKHTPRAKYNDRIASLFVVRNARNPPSKASLAVLKSLGIDKRYTATFVPNTASELLRLRSVQPFVFYGYLNTELLQTLFMKRLRFKRVPKDETDRDVQDLENIDTGVANVDEGEEDDDENTTRGDSFPVTDNVTVEDRLGKSAGLLCIEDVIEVVKNCSTQFHQLMSHIAPFQLSDILKAEGVEANVIESGDIGFKINSKVSKLM